jgi:hypothetical protein
MKSRHAAHFQLLSHLPFFAIGQSGSTHVLRFAAESYRIPTRSRAKRSAHGESSIDVPPVADFLHKHEQYRVTNLVDHSVSADSQTQRAVSSNERFYPAGPRIIGKGFDSPDEPNARSDRQRSLRFVLEARFDLREGDGTVLADVRACLARAVAI